jgi:type II secretory pathway pseudopilin PulG
MSVIPPPPPMRRQDDGCWKWGLIGCGSLLVVGVLGIAALVYFGAKSPMVKQAIGAAMQSQEAMQQLKTVGRALDSFVADKKKYPKELKELIPNYLPDERSLHISQDSGSPRIWYKKPPENAPGETIVLQTDITPPIALPDAKPWSIKLRKDGRLEGTEYVYTDKTGRHQRIEFGAP